MHVRYAHLFMNPEATQRDVRSVGGVVPTRYGHSITLRTISVSAQSVAPRSRLE